jgi:hypothetical protein
VNRQNEDPSPIAARNSNGLKFPEGQMDIASVAARKREDLGLGEMAKPGGAMPGIL